MSNDGIVTSAYETVVEQLAYVRPPIGGLDDELFTCGGPRPKTLIEISGYPNTGKTLLLSYIMARCLPPTYFGGNYSDIVFVNMGHKFSIPKFRENIRRIIIESKEKCTPDECEAVIESCLESVTVFECFSASEFELFFDAIEDILLKNRFINLIAIDDIDAFYWEDTHNKLVRMSTHFERITARLRKLCENHNICCVYTVNSNYVQCKNKNHKQKHHSNKNPEYVFKLKHFPGGSRKLNKQPITTSNSGINFLKENKLVL